MTEITKFDAQKKKLDDLCQEHNLTYRFYKECYPIRLTIRPLQGFGEQISMLEAADGEDYISPDASMTWIFKDCELSSTVSGGTFTISKTLRAKIENILLKMVSFWEQYFFRYLIEGNRLSQRQLPVIDESQHEDPPEAAPNSDDEDIPDGEEYAGTVEDDLIADAIQLVRMENAASVSMLQRRFNIGYSKATVLMEVLEQRGIVGPYRGGEPREVLPEDVPES